MKSTIGPKGRTCLIVALLVAAFMPALSQPNNPWRLTLVEAGMGLYDARRRNISSLQEIELNLPASVWRLHAFAGFATTSTDDSYLYVGMRTESFLPPPVIISLSFAAGLFNKGAGIDLGYPLEFRSAVKAGWQFRNGYSVGLELSHLSHGHLTDYNPGLETLAIVYTFPVRF
jgi:hypothetical protein